MVARLAQQVLQPPRDLSKSEKASWEYVRVSGLGIIPGLCCPHHDQVQSNGVHRAKDFDQMLLRNPGEVGICIDNSAAFIVEGDNWRTISADPEHGAGVRRKVVDNGVVTQSDLACEAAWLPLEQIMCPPDFVTLNLSRL